MHILFARRVCVGPSRLCLAFLDSDIDPSRRTDSISSSASRKALRSPSQPSASPVSEPPPDGSRFDARLKSYWFGDTSLQCRRRLFGEPERSITLVSLKRSDSSIGRPDRSPTSFQYDPAFYGQCTYYACWRHVPVRLLTQYSAFTLI